MKYEQLIAAARSLGMPVGRRIALSTQVVVEPTVWEGSIATAANPTDVVDLLDPANSVDPNFGTNLAWRDSQSDVSILWYGAELVVLPVSNAGDEPTPDDIAAIRQSLYLRYDPDGRSYFYPLYEGVYSSPVYRQVSQATAADDVSYAYDGKDRLAVWRFNLFAPQIKSVNALALHQRPSTLSATFPVRLRLHGIVASPSLTDAPNTGDCAQAPSPEVLRALTQNRIISIQGGS